MEITWLVFFFVLLLCWQIFFVHFGDSAKCRALLNTRTHTHTYTRAHSSNLKHAVSIEFQILIVLFKIHHWTFSSHLHTRNRLKQQQQQWHQTNKQKTMFGLMRENDEWKMKQKCSHLVHRQKETKIINNIIFVLHNNLRI